MILTKDIDSNIQLHVKKGLGIGMEPRSYIWGVQKYGGKNHSVVCVQQNCNLLTLFRNCMKINCVKGSQMKRICVKRRSQILDDL